MPLRPDALRIEHRAATVLRVVRGGALEPSMLRVNAPRSADFQRVDFAAITRNTGYIEKSATRTIANLVARAAWRILGDEMRLAELLDRDVADIGELAFAPDDVNKLRTACRDALVAGWVVGITQTRRESRKIVAETPRVQPLYVHRPLLNGDELVAWAKAEGFETTLPPEKLHVTIAYSKKPVDWSTMPRLQIDDELGVATTRGRKVTPLGDGGAVVLKFQSDALANRWEQLKSAGASWDYDGYHPHVTITWDAPPDLDLSKVKPFRGTLRFGPEIWEPLDEDWGDNVVEMARYRFHTPGGVEHDQKSHAGDDSGAAERGVAKVESWHDASAKSYVVVSLDSEGNQIGDATYVGTKIEAEMDQAIRQRDIPFDPSKLRGSELTKEQQRLEKLDSKLNAYMIERGRGYEKPSETVTKGDMLSIARVAVWNRQATLRNEVQQRAGPGYNTLPHGVGAKPRNFTTRVDFAVDLREQAADYFDANGFRMAGNISDGARALIQQELMRAVRTGETGRGVAGRIFGRLVERGFTDAEGVETEVDDEEVLADLFDLDDPDKVPGYLNTLVRTNVFEAMNEARYAEFTDPALEGYVVAFEYSAILDENTTEFCEYMDGRVYAVDSDVWDTHRPPNHYNCRSVLIPVTRLSDWDGVESDAPTVEPSVGFTVRAHACKFHTPGGVDHDQKSHGGDGGGRVPDPKIVEGAAAIRAMSIDERDNIAPWDAPGGVKAWNLYEGQKLAPKETGKLKRVTSTNTHNLNTEYDAVINVGGRVYGISKYEDPDADDDNTDDDGNVRQYVYAYEPLDAPTGRLVETQSAAVSDLIEHIKGRREFTRTDFHTPGGVDHDQKSHGGGDGGVGVGASFDTPVFKSDAGKEARAWRAANEERYRNDPEFKATVDAVTLFTQGDYQFIRAASEYAATGDDAVLATGGEVWKRRIDEPLSGYNAMADYKAYFEAQGDLHNGEGRVTGREAGAVLNRAIDTAPETTSAIYRGLTSRDAYAAALDLKPGDTFDIRGATSFTASADVAGKFAAGTASGQGARGAPSLTQTVIEIEPGTRALNVSALSPWRQQEMLTRGRFEVSEVRKEKYDVHKGGYVYTGDRATVVLRVKN